MINTIDLKLTIEDLQIIDAALAEMPYRMVSQLIANINLQLNPQEQQEDYQTVNN